MVKGSGEGGVADQKMSMAPLDFLQKWRENFENVFPPSGWARLGEVKLSAGRFRRCLPTSSKNLEPHSLINIQICFTKVPSDCREK